MKRDGERDKERERGMSTVLFLNWQQHSDRTDTGRAKMVSKRQREQSLVGIFAEHRGNSANSVLHRTPLRPQIENTDKKLKS